MTFRKRGGRKQMIAPDGARSWVPARALGVTERTVKHRHASFASLGLL
jgi:hypothetical protein